MKDETQMYNSSCVLSIYEINECKSSAESDVF